MEFMRVLFRSDDRLSWMVGGFYLRSNPSGPWGNLVGFAQIPGAEAGRAAYNFITEDSKAVSGHVTYDLDALVDGLQFEAGKIGRASCRERVVQDVLILVADGSLKKKKIK